MLSSLGKCEAGILFQCAVHGSTGGGEAAPAQQTHSTAQIPLCGTSQSEI